MNKSTLIRIAAISATLLGLAVFVMAMQALVAARMFPAVAEILARALAFPA